MAQVCCYNEVEKGNLDRCLDNLIKYCDRVIIYDDASTDDSVEVAEAYGCHVIKGQANNQMQELAHKQLMLEAAVDMGATHLFWLDCDEVLDRPGTMGGLRGLCENWPAGLDAYSFRELNLWRSQTWVRTDTLFAKARFVRLWKASQNIRFNVVDGVHKQLYPATIHNITEAPFGVIHYGFHDYKKMLVKIGANQFNRHELHNNSLTNWILDERNCSCYRLPDDQFPPGCLPPDIWERPLPRLLEDLSIYRDTPDSPQFPLVDARSLGEWDRLHRAGYHGGYEEIHDRNKNVWRNMVSSRSERASLFRFDPDGETVFDLGCGGGWHMLDCIINGAKKVIGVDVNDDLMDMAKRSFRELGVKKQAYGFFNPLNLCNSRDRGDWHLADIVYSVAMFMHIPFWQAVRYFQWIGQVLKPDGEAHLQFYQEPDSRMTMFWEGTTEGKDDGVSTVRLEHELERAGLRIQSRRMAVGLGILPVWKMYHCTKEAT